MQSPTRTSSRRQRQAIATRQILTFSLGGEWFGLLLEEALKVIPLDRTYQAPGEDHLRLTLHQGQEITLLDLGFCLFGRHGALASPAGFALLLPPTDGQWLGIPLAGVPAIRRVPLDAIKPLPPIYQEHTKLHCVSEMMLEAQEQRPAVFLLNPHRLRQRHILQQIQVFES